MSTSAHAPATDTQLDPSARATILRSNFLPNGHWLYHFLSDAHLSADSLALSHLWCRQLRVEVPTRTRIFCGTVTHWSGRWTKLSTAGRDSFFLSHPKTNTHYWPLVVWRIFRFWCPWWCWCQESPPPKWQIWQIYSMSRTESPR